MSSLTGQSFKKTYLKAAKEILAEDEALVQTLPGRFIELVKSTMKDRSLKKEEATKWLEAMGIRG